MLPKRFLLLVALAAQVVPAPAAWAAAGSLEELLQQTKNARAIQTKANAAREREFLARRDEQSKLVAEAVRQRDAAEARSQALSTQYDQNELRTNELQTILDSRLGSLGELFGVVRQVSGDVSSVVFQSMISAQHPGRDEFFAGLAKAKELPSITKLEQLWFEMLRQMTESGRVARFDTEIVGSDGASIASEVVRIGPFIAMSEGRYLNYLPAVKQLALLPRQPAGWLTSLAKDVQDVQSGYVEAAVDPSRGVLLSLYVQRPSWVERIERGEAVNYVILFVGAAGVICFVFQFIYLVRVRFAVSRQVRNLDRPSNDNPLGRVLGTFQGDVTAAEEDPEVVELRISEAVLREVPLLERFQPFLRLAVAAGPLLGLVGTVVGMIITFQAITESGQSDPRLMAHGIGSAMIATVLGLGIAVPLLFANAGLASLSRALVQTLDEQSTGLLAERLERDRDSRGGGGQRA
ncbi:MAG: MotA/TolQ/ExbB proton channel family protein [Myxococcales bacterium]|nr:MAG: MotA/TolQ/ExbB proton channel family protein [Myxococcales bacterium]